MFGIDLPEPPKINVSVNKKDENEKYSAPPSLKVNVSIPTDQQESN